MDDTALRIRTARLSDAPALLKIYAPYVEKTAITFECTVPDIEEFAAGQTAAEKRELQAVFGQSLEIPADCNLLTLAEKADASGLPKLYMACGEQDGLYAANVRLTDKLTALGADIRFEHWEGIHNWVFWDAAVRKALDYLL